jgi:hypothetical protein
LQPIGIIANPASGKDIRRLVAYGSVFDNNEKTNIVRRLLLGLDAAGVGEVLFMPDYFGIGVRALENLEVGLKTGFLDMAMEGTQEDSTFAAARLNELGAACIITLGGDGTSRAVAKGCRDTPLLSISTGTNNVFPSMIESTLAGIAAGLLCTHPSLASTCLHRMPRLDIRSSEKLVDLALVDVVTAPPGFIASRALWDVSSIRDIFLARVEAGHIGFSSVGGNLGVDLRSDQGLHLVIGDQGQEVLAPIAPGLIRWVKIKSCRPIDPGEAIPILPTPGLAALDGERELIVKAGDQLTVSLNRDGPRVVDTTETIRRAAAEGLFIKPSSKS